MKWHIEWWLKLCYCFIQTKCIGFHSGVTYEINGLWWVYYVTSYPALPRVRDLQALRFPKTFTERDRTVPGTFIVNPCSVSKNYISDSDTQKCFSEVISMPVLQIRGVGLGKEVSLAEALSMLLHEWITYSRCRFLILDGVASFLLFFTVTFWHGNG